jgi:hypothetical protein
MWISPEWNAMVVAQASTVETTSHVASAASSAGGRDRKVKMTFESHSPARLPLRHKVGLHRLLL